ncbi:hypothetical protein DM02DRAFT_634897 [Periconia macrospinosa]|uniref:Uncharacterized protein n=1 Tax=Periconia macrospinosa TaxID=97972 RepID=A0A2V1D4W0_9PLEO|nr:hypothetical protein DM02DRAFT_634897 [Periconia macrospinosa]
MNARLVNHEVSIRSDLHDTNSTGRGNYGKDPKGFHVTFCFNDSEQEKTKMHMTVHAYTSGKGDYTLKEAVQRPEKPDNTHRKNDRSVWPEGEEVLEEYEDSPVVLNTKRT